MLKEKQAQTPIKEKIEIKDNESVLDVTKSFFDGKEKFTYSIIKDKETDKAFCLRRKYSWGNKWRFWLPKSRVKKVNNSFIIPNWLIETNSIELRVAK